MKNILLLLLIFMAVSPVRSAVMGKPAHGSPARVMNENDDCEEEEPENPPEE